MAKKKVEPLNDEVKKTDPEEYKSKNEKEEFPIPTDKEKGLFKRDWLIRTVEIFTMLETNTIYSPAHVRKFFNAQRNDSITLQTSEKLLEAIIEAQKNGLLFIINGKVRKIIEKKTPYNDILYELIDFETE